MKKILIIAILIVFAINFFNENNNSFDETTLVNVDMKPFSVPIQKNLTKKDKKQNLNKKYSDKEIVITPLYKYKIYARVYSKKHYPLDPNPAPYDLALGWDGLEKEEVFNTITAWQSFRWVHWRLKPGCPYDVNGVYLRLANNHIIPANDNILKGVKKLKRKDVVYMEGYLVSVKRPRGKGSEKIVSSTSRTDRGAGSCEIIYVTRLVSKYGEFK